MSHRYGNFRAALILVLVATLAPAATPADDAREFMRRTFDQGRITFHGKMSLESPGDIERRLDVNHRQIGETGMTYIEITAPYYLKNTRFLSFDHQHAEDEHFTYVPMVKRSMRVPQWTLQQPFLGSDFYMVDIAVPDMDQFRYELDGDGAVAGQTCRRVVSVPKIPEGEPYAKVIYCVDPTKLLSIHNDYFDKDGELLKVWEPSRVEEIDGVWTPLDQTMRNVQTGTVSRLQILEIHYNVDLDDNLFGKAHLDR